MSTQKSYRFNRIQASALIIVLCLVVTGAIVIPMSHGEASKQNAQASTAATTDAQPSSEAVATYKDGMYTSSGSYVSPGGRESIAITLTLSGGNVTATSAVSGATDSTARSYQNIFIKNYSAQVVGKPIASLKLSNVSGSSLTPQGFNDAVAQIKTEAKQ